MHKSSTFVFSTLTSIITINTIPLTVKYSKSKYQKKIQLYSRCTLDFSRMNGWKMYQMGEYTKNTQPIISKWLVVILSLSFSLFPSLSHLMFDEQWLELGTEYQSSWVWERNFSVAPGILIQCICLSVYVCVCVWGVFLICTSKLGIKYKMWE